MKYKTVVQKFTEKQIKNLKKDHCQKITPEALDSLLFSYNRIILDFDLK